MKLAFLDKSPQVGLPQAEPYPYNPQTGQPWEPWELEEIDMFMKMRLTRGVVQILGIPRSGKSTLMVWFGYKLRKYFGMQVASDFPLKAAFGEYYYMDDLTFLEELEMMVDIVNAYKDGDEGAFRESGSHLYRAAVLWDEAHKSLNKRRPGTGEVVLKTEACSLYGHYQSLFLFASPGTGLIEHIRLKDFITHDISATFDNRAGRSIYSMYSRYDMQSWVLTLGIADWAPLFDSFCPVAPSIPVLHSTMEKVIKSQGVIQKYKDLKAEMEKGRRKKKGAKDDDEDTGDGLET